MIRQKKILITTSVILLVAIWTFGQKTMRPPSASQRSYVENSFFSEKTDVRKFEIKVKNTTILAEKQLTTSIEAKGLFHVLNESIFSINLSDVSGSITGQGNNSPDWDLLNQGSAIIKFENDKMWLAWKGEPLGDLEHNALRMLAGAFPPMQKFIGNATVSYELEDLYSSGKWIWIASNLSPQSMKWSASYLAGSKKQDDFFKRNVNWQILKNRDAWSVSGHDVMELPLDGSKGLNIDVTVDIQLNTISKAAFNLGMYSNPAFGLLSEGRSAQKSSNSYGSEPVNQRQLTKDEWIEDFKIGAKIDYLALKKSLDRGDWNVADINSVLADSRVGKIPFNNLLGALSQTKWEGGKQILIGYLNEHWKDETKLVNYIPLIAQGPGDAAEIDAWLQNAGKLHPSSDVRTTAILARGTLASVNKKENNAKSQIIFNELIAELSATKDINKIENLLSALGNAGGENLSLKFKPWLSHGEPAIRAQAYFSLRNDSAQEQAYETLVQGLTDRNRLVRLRSAQALAGMDISTDKSLNLKSLYDKEVDSQVKNAISEVLGRL